MDGLKLDEGFEDQLPLSDFLPGAASGGGQQSMVPPLPQQPMPNVQTQQPAQVATNTGLTPTENALLSEEEKQITLRNRGLA